jgi:hypothetical protein
VAVFVLSAASAQAEEAPKRTFFIESPSAADCPAVSSFAWRVLARTSQAAEAPAVTADVRFLVTVSLDADGAVGTLEVLKGGKPSVRHMRAVNCEEVVDALALVAAVIVDPNASTKPIGPPPAVTNTPPSSAPTPAATTPRTAPTATTPSTKESQPPAAPPATRLAALQGDLQTHGRFRFGAGARGLVTQGVAPGIVAGAGGFATLRYDADGSAWSPVVLVGVSYAKSGTVESRLKDGRPLGTAEFRRLAFELTECPLRTPVSGPIAVMPCVGIEVGQLTATGQAATNSDTSSAAWLATTAALKLYWTPIDVFALDLTAGGFLSLSRDDFYFEASPSAAERVTVHEIPPLGANASVGVTAMLP